MAQWIAYQSSELGVAGSSPAALVFFYNTENRQCKSNSFSGFSFVAFLLNAGLFVEAARDWPALMVRPPILLWWRSAPKAAARAGVDLEVHMAKSALSLKKSGPARGLRSGPLLGQLVQTSPSSPPVPVRLYRYVIVAMQVLAHST